MYLEVQGKIFVTHALLKLNVFAYFTFFDKKIFYLMNFVAPCKQFTQFTKIDNFCLFLTIHIILSENCEDKTLIFC